MIHSRQTRECWALRKRDGTYLFADGCWVAPWIFGNREAARKTARECRELGINFRAVRINLTVIVEEAK